MSQIKRMLIPTDFSAASSLALQYGLDMAFRYGASIHLMHVIEDPAFSTVYPDAYFAELPDLMKRLTEDSEKQLADAVAKCAAANVPATSQVVVGRPARAIAKEALDRGTDLIVMGTHGRSGFAHLVLGSVAERVIRTSPCPVLTVRDTSRVADAIALEAAANRAPVELSA
jgi:nucleotide-binding universal stress UspA family protein